MKEELKIMPTVYFLILLVCSIIVHFLFPIMRVIKMPWNFSGILLIVFGFVINVWTDRLFKDNKTTVKPHLCPNALIVHGPFRICRHPMYMGMEAVLIGLAVLLGSITTFIIPILFIIFMELIFIPLEERILEDEFGEEYLEYKKNTRRWI